MLYPDVPRYALFEIERRWLVNPQQAPDLRGTGSRLYEDLYVDDTRLRLRRITEPDGNVVYKLGKKYGKRSAILEPITTLYLDEREYALLSVLPGSSSIKRRYSVAGGSLDLYQEPNAGLMIFELEFVSEDAAAAYQPPTFVTREISGERHYSGYQLARRRIDHV